MKSKVEIYPPCRMCGDSRYKILLCEKKAETKEKFSLIQCKKCTFISTYPILNEETLKSHYYPNYWESVRKNKSFFTKAFLSLRLSLILYELKQYVPTRGRILDWGAGDGAWVRLLRKNGFDAWGVDMFSNPEHSNFLLKGSLHSVKFEDNYFDAITCLHVLEHLKNPINGITEALRILKPGGIMIVEVPNINSLGFYIFGVKWQPLQLPTHFNHFTTETLSKCLKIGEQTDLIKLSHFSAKASPSAFVLSIFPKMSPKHLRNKLNGTYPLYYKLIYLILQITALPFVLGGILTQKGCIIRGYFRKR